MSEPKRNRAVNVSAETSHGNSDVDALNALFDQGWTLDQMCANGVAGIVVIVTKGGNDD